MQVSGRGGEMKERNRLKSVLGQGGIALGTLVVSNSPAIVEVAGHSGLDYVRIESEHSWRRDDSMEHMIRAAWLSGITPILRIDKTDLSVVGRAFEIGAGGVVAAGISSREEMERVVDAAHFPPKGSRGFSHGCFSGQWGLLNIDDYMELSEKETMVGIMVENGECVERLPEILAVEGVDFALFGPADYSLSIGLGKPQKNHPLVQDGIMKTIEAGQKEGKPVGIGLGPVWEEEAEKYIGMGCRMVEIAQDVGILGTVWKTTSANIRKRHPSYSL
jgi:4-hydroxy-2-oxoheptanedioate aldolase